MTEAKDWALPEELRPDPRLLRYELGAALRAMVLLRAEVPDDAFTAGVLGTERVGNGAVIRVDDRDLVLTIGYLVTEATTIWLSCPSGRVLQGHALAYDYATGLGVVQPLGSLDGGALELGSDADLESGDDLVVIGHGGLPHTLACQLIARQEFAGYWEYLLEEALFTAPAYPLWSGSALLGPDGRIVGVGSLLTQTPGERGSVQTNLFVPAALAAPLLRDLLQHGQSRRPARPWLGVYSTEGADGVHINGLVAHGPAHAAGVSLGDVVIAVAGEPVQSLAGFYRALWGLGAAGVAVQLTLARGSARIDVTVNSAPREAFLKQPRRH